MTGELGEWYVRGGLALLTDLYQLTMMAGQWKHGRSEQQVSFDYFFRSLPPHAGFAVFAGLGPFLDYLDRLQFSEDDIDYLRGQAIFDADFLEYLRDFRPRFTVRAMPEGSLSFPFEPMVQVEGTILEAQLVETALLNLLNYPTLIATKACRICLAADGDPVLEFGLRRAHGPDGGLSGSRAAYIGGCTSSSNVLAGKVYGIPIAGTHAHSWVMSFPSELEAFRAFALHYPERCVLLVDTYDTETSGVPNAIRVFQEMRERGVNVRPAIRLDSGDLSRLSKVAHRMMLEAGLDDPLIVASNDLDEDLIADLKRQGAKINAWGVGTHLITSRECPSLSGVYKLVAVHDKGGWVPRMKISSNVEKATDPGRKGLHRCYDEEGHPVGDLMCFAEEAAPEAGSVLGRIRSRPHQRAKLRRVARSEQILCTVFENGERKVDAPPITRVRAFVQEQLATLPEEFKRMRFPEIYNVLLSERIGELKDEMLANPELA